MEENKKVYKFDGKPGEDFQLWAARTETALRAKKVYNTVMNDVVGANDELAQEMQEKVDEACEIIVRGLGDKPLRMCISEKRNPHKMWNR